MDLPFKLTSKKKWMYLPWTSFLTTIIMLVGLIMWAVSSQQALDNIRNILSALNLVEVKQNGAVFWLRTGGAAIVALYATFTLILLLFRLCRARIEATIDKTGRITSGSTIWMILYAIVVFFWWLITILLVVVIMASCVWYGGVYAIHVMINSVIRTQLNSNNGTALNLTDPVVFANISTTDGTCASQCLDLNILRDVGIRVPINNTCICEMKKLTFVNAESVSCYQQIYVVMIGAFIMFIGATLVLTNSVAEFARASREKDVFKRARKYFDDTPGQDNLPLLNQQPMMMTGTMGPGMGMGMGPGGMPMGSSQVMVNQQRGGDMYTPQQL